MAAAKCCISVSEREGFASPAKRERVCFEVELVSAPDMYHTPMKTNVIGVMNAIAPD